MLSRELCPLLAMPMPQKLSCRVHLRHGTADRAVSLPERMTARDDRFVLRRFEGEGHYSLPINRF